MYKLLALLCLTLLTSACGFQLRGNYDLPFETLYIALPENNQLHALLKRNIESSSKTKIVVDPATAQASLYIINDLSTKVILSLSSSGRVREYQLVRQFTFRVRSNDGIEFIPQSDITIRRDLAFSDATVLSKESEEALLQRDMQTDLVQQLMRRLATAKVTAPVPANATAR